jgi:hypothetical protein
MFTDTMDNIADSIVRANNIMCFSALKYRLAVEVKNYSPIFKRSNLITYFDSLNKSSTVDLIFKWNSDFKYAMNLNDFTSLITITPKGVKIYINDTEYPIAEGMAKIHTFLQHTYLLLTAFSN